MSMQTDQVESKIEGLVRSITESNEKIDWDKELLSNGFVASIHLLHIIAFIEEQFAIEIDPFEIRPEIFESINSIAEFVREKQQS